MKRATRGKRSPRLGTLLSTVSLTDLRAALDHRHRLESRRIEELTRKRTVLARKMAGLDAQIADIEESIESPARAAGVKRGPGRPRKVAAARRGRPPGTTKKEKPAAKAPATRKAVRGRAVKKAAATATRGTRKPTFCDLAAEVLKEGGKPLHQRDIAARLIATKGVKSSSQAFDRSLGLMLAKDSRFKKVKRAVYRLA